MNLLLKSKKCDMKKKIKNIWFYDQLETNSLGFKKLESGSPFCHEAIFTKIILLIIVSLILYHS